MNLTQKHFERAAQHHVVLSKHHRAIAKSARKGLSKTAKSDLEHVDAEALTELLENFAAEHDAIADEHADFSAHCEKCAKAAADEAEKVAEKAARDRLVKRDDLEKLPLGFTRLAPTAHPRAGSPPVAVAVEGELVKVLGTSPSDQHAQE